MQTTVASSFSPRSHTTRVGVAVTDTLNPASDASTVRGRHAAGSIHNQVGNPTSWSMSMAGEVAGTGNANGIESATCRATASSNGPSMPGS